MTSRSDDEYNRREAVCSWKHCPRASKELAPGEGVRAGNRWMHKRCAELCHGIAAVRDCYYENVSRNVVIKQLVSVINNLVLVKNNDPRYMVFAIKYAVKNNIEIKGPYSLHYLVTNYRIQDAWQRYNRRNRLAKMIKEQKAEEMKISPPDATTEKYETKRGGFGSIFD